MKNRIFTSINQLDFAELAGDYNPLHIDEIAARRLLFGAQAVHGIHALLWSLDCYLENRTDKYVITSVKAVFSKPIKVGEELCYLLQNENNGCLKIKLLSNGLVTTTINFELKKSKFRNTDELHTSSPKKLRPRDLSDNEIEVDSGTLDLFLNIKAATKMLPHLSRCISSLQIAEILSTTRLVGSICPGLHSLYSELDLSATKPNKITTTTYEVVEYDKRFNLVVMNVVTPGLTGVVKAFRRPKPLEQASFQDLKKHSRSNEFAGQQAIIIGGSRGLGEVAAKLLAGGGANVKLTYYRGKEETGKIVDDITSNGGTASCFQFNALNPIINDLINWSVADLYYFATPFIFSGVSGTFSPKLFNNFCEYYVAGFINTVNKLKDSGVEIKHIFHPSSVAVDELPADMGEYATAKLASEMLCDYMEKTNRNMIIYKPRLPRMATDQTNSIMPVFNEDPVSILINELRSFRDYVAEN